MEKLAECSAFLDIMPKAVTLYDADIIRVIVDKSPMPSETARVARDKILTAVYTANKKTLIALKDMADVVAARAAEWPTTTASTSRLLDAAVRAWAFGYLNELLVAVEATKVQILPKVSKAYAASSLVSVSTSKLEDSVSSMYYLFESLDKYGWLDEDMKVLTAMTRPAAGQEQDII